MKCAQCGYYNLPGAAVCGRCKSSLTADSGAPVAPPPKPVTPAADYYPPRARDRSLTDNVRLHVRPPEALATRVRSLPRPSMHLLRAAGGSSRLSIQPTLSQSDMLLICFAPLPGCVQWIQKRRRAAIAFFGAFFTLCLGAIATIHSDASTVFIWLIALVVLASIVDACWRAAIVNSTASPEFQRLRAGMLAFQSFCALGLSITSVFIFLAQYFPIYEMRTDLAAPTLLNGDGIIVQSWSDPLHNARRGDVIMVIMDNYYPVTERLIGLPGDRVEYANGGLWVNGRPLRTPELPIAFQPASNPFAVAVPKGEFFIWRAMARPYTEERGGDPMQTTQSYLLVSPEDVRGKVIAVYTPPARRRWLR
ncbi:hypothetical protein CCAX7_37530 [Capsulimonas corticalis]|uniref:Signal peptidase I n=1 Tax=Capsulimonas corticalis TaxID=2219043 RepID=A0A402D165_9BACT|nr:signal peptidase I [Capsulimonas corticalis]BDI31702.1 hypothetical protein CCAX7_37530 [Capsulimonas corticalis]